MTCHSNPKTVLCAAVLAAIFATPIATASLVGSWATVVNNADIAPAGTTEKFFSYNQPSVNDAGLVAFRARARAPTGSGGGGGGEPVRGIFTRDMATAGNPINTIASNKTPNNLVPGPNNLAATFNEFPAFPRIDARADTVVFRGQSTPVWQYTDATGADTRAGTSGVYANPAGTLTTGASLLGSVPGFSQYSVPGTSPGTKFDQFPGGPTVTGNTVAFKGNWTDPVNGGQTGIYTRDLVADGGSSPIKKVASSGDTFNFQDGSSFVFGSTAPPSASDGRLVFTGLDNEAAPTAGGIFMAALSDPLNAVKSLVRIGVDTAVNVGQGLSELLNFKQIGEGLSFDKNHVGFWGGWGTETRDVTVRCPTDGNAAMLAAC